MNTQSVDEKCSSLAAMVAPEDLRLGDFVAILSEIIELPSYCWTEMLACERDEVVRVRRLPTEDRAPLKIKAICLPFVFVKSPSGQFQTLDVRLASLARLEQSYAKKVWKNLKPKLPDRTGAVS